MGWWIEALYEDEHRAGFAGGTAGDVEEVDEFGGGAAFEAFGDVVGDGQRRTAELVAEVARLGEELVAGEDVYADGQFHGGFPDGKVFESLVFHCGSLKMISNLIFEISEFRCPFYDGDFFFC